MSFKAWTAAVMVPLAAAFTVSTAPTASAVGTAPTGTTVGAATQATLTDPPVGRRPVDRRPIVRDRQIVRRPIFRDPVRRPIVRDRVIVRRPVVRRIVLVDPFEQCFPFLDEDGNFRDIGRHDDLFDACADFFEPVD